MGSGVSKSDANGVTLPARFRPVFLQRLEELTARRHNRPLKDSSTLSKKELLLHDKDDNDNASHHSKTTPMPHENSSAGHCKKSEEPKRKEAEKPKQEASDKESRIAMSKDKNHDVVKVESLKSKGKDDQKENVAKEEDVFKDFDDEEDDDDDDDARMIGHEDDEAFPGSPSFRVYFKDNGEDDHNDNCDDHNDIGTANAGKDDSYKTKAPSDDVVTPEESSVSKQANRSKKRRSFKKVFPKGGQAAVKNLLNVTACYTPSHSSHERNHLLTDKA